MAKYELSLTSGNVFSTPVTLTVTPTEGPSVTVSGSSAISTPVELAVLNSIGPRGETGPQGPQGPQGIQGSPGDSVNLQIFDGNIAVGQSVLTTDDVTFNSVTTTGDVTVGGILTAAVSGPFVGDVTVEAGDTLDVSAGTLTLADNQISGDKVEGGTIDAITINTLTSTSISGDLTGDVTGDVTGNLTGNVTGNVTGDVTGNLTGNVTGNVTGDLTGNADTADALTFIVRNSTGATLTKGTAVYVSGIQGNTPEVSPARADSSATMPAFGLVQADIAASGDGVVTTFGSLLGLSVANFGETGVTFSLGDTVYISATEAGKLTNAAPAGEANSIQNIGKIERAAPTTNMTIKVGGAGRTNATPNLDDGDIFIGNSSNQAVTSDLNSEVRSRVSASGDLSYNQATGDFSFTERTDAEVRGLISSTDNGGDGSLSYDNTTGIISYTGPSASEVRAHFSGGTGVTITNGEVAIGQPVATTDDVTFDDVTLTGQLKGPATFTIDPAAHGDDTGTVVVAGNLQVDGTTTTINSTIVEIDDLNLKLAAEATTNAQANGAGITVGDGLANITYNSGTDRWVLDKELSADVVGTVSGDVTGNVTGNLTGNVTGTVSTLTNHDTDDLAEGTTKLYYTDERVDDRVSNLVTDGTGITTTYDDVANTLTFSHSNSVTGGTVSEGGVARQLTYGGAFNVPSVTYDNEGHITGTTTTQITLPASDNTDTTYTNGNGLDLNGTEFSHSDTSSQSSLATLTGADVVSDIDLDSFGHVTALATRTMTLGDLGYTGATDADNYSSWSVSDGTNSETIGSGDTLNFAGSGASTVSYDTVSNTLTVSSPSIGAGTGIQYTGSTLNLDFSELTDMTGDISGTTEFILQDGTTESRKAASEIKLSQFDRTGLDADLLDGQQGSYYLDWTNTNNKPDPTITLSGDLSGAVTLTDLASGTLNATISANSVALGTDTTGNYVADVDGTPNQIEVTYAPLEGGTPVIGLTNDVTIPNNLTVSGDLTVNGTNTIVDSTTVAVADSLFKLAKDNTADSLDAGWYGVYNDGTEKYAGIARDASDNGKFILYDGLTVEPTTTVDTAGTGFNKATLKADIEGDVTGNVTVGATKTLDVSSGTLTLADNQISGDKINGGTIDSITISSVNIDGGTVDGATIATSDITVGTGKTLDVSGGALTLADDQISGDKIEGGTIGSVAITTADINGGNIDGTVIGGTTAAAITGTTGQFDTSLNVDGTITADGLNLGDNEKIQLGASNDFQIYHSGTGSFILDNGPGDLRILGENNVEIGNIAAVPYFRGTNGGAASLFYNGGAPKLATTSTGVDVTGTVTADGLTVDTDTLHVDATNNRVGVGTTSPYNKLQVSSVPPTSVPAAGSADHPFSIGTTPYGIAGGVTSSGYGYLQSTRFDGTATNYPLLLNPNGGNVGISKANPSTALDVTGTITADGLTLANATYLTQNDSASGQPRMFGMNSSNITYVGPIDPYAGGAIFYGVSGDVTDQRFFTNSDERLRISSIGDISFYEDTGTTAKFFWDASAERLGIGTTTPSTALDVTGTVTADQYDTDEALPTSNPSLSLDFGNSVQIDPRINFSRASIGTYFDGQYIRTAGPDEPRIEYAADGTVKGLLIEEQRENLVTHSEDFSNAAWGKFGGGVIVADAATSPDGTSNASQFYGSDGAHVIEDISATAGTTYTYSMFVKTNGTADLTVAINFRSSGGSINYFGVDIDTTTGAVSAPALGLQSTSSNVQDVGNGWFRLSISHEAPATTITARAYMANRTGAAASSSDGYLIYGAQLEAGSFPTSYIPTNGTEVTREPDIATLPVSEFNYNQSAGTVLVEASPMSDGTSTAVNLGLSTDTGGTANRWQIRSQSTNTVRVLTAIPGNDPFSTLGSVLDVTGITIPGTYKAAHTFEENYSQVAVNGSLSTADTTVSVPDTDEIRIGTRSSSGTETLNGHIRSLKYWPQRLSDATLQAVTQG